MNDLIIEQASKSFFITADDDDIDGATVIVQLAEEEGFGYERARKTLERTFGEGFAIRYNRVKFLLFSIILNDMAGFLPPDCTFFCTIIFATERK